MATSGKHQLEMWGGIECTVNRVGDVYLDQMARNGHTRRADDIDLIASLGIQSIRYPVLWEHVAPDDRAPKNWAFSDDRLDRLREAHIKPIVGLTHHGSGPRYTSLIDPAFPQKLAAYARACAERYPWVTDFTPVNEPLTTARFSGLYGHWYPHGKDARTFVQALLSQCRGVVLAMAAIREVTPDARLIQTEDLGRIYSSPSLQDLAELYNHRRWLSLDLLCGRIDSSHPLRDCLLMWGASHAELAWFEEHACPPDIIGINHYLTSDRFLDDKLDPYPRSRQVHQNTGSYADVEAVRVDLNIPVGTCSALRETWERYHLPLAVTEAHLGGTREQQMRWLYEVWQGARQLRKEGGDVRAVTAWSLFGAFDWNILVTREQGFYEPGVFDVRGPKPRPTALARLVRSLATTGDGGDEPLLASPGWWRRPDRLFQPPASGRTFEQTNSQPASDMEDRSLRPLLLLGPTGTLGSAFVRLCDVRGIPYHVLSRTDLDLTDSFSIERMLDETNAWGVINAAGYVQVDQAELNPDTCMKVNTSAPVTLAQVCGRRGLPFMTFSSDLVFDGVGAVEPYVESQPIAPLGVYGRSKAEMERQVLLTAPGSLIVRTSAFFGPWDEGNFVTATLNALKDGKVVKAANDQVVSPTYIPDLVHAALDLFIDGERGIWHLANHGALTWSELARRAAQLANVSDVLVQPMSSQAIGLLAARPQYSALGSERGFVMPSLESALQRYLIEREDPELFRKPWVDGVAPHAWLGPTRRTGFPRRNRTSRTVLAAE